MPFRTKLDYSNNRQIKQYPETFTALSGGTTFGVAFSALTVGPSTIFSGVSQSIIGVDSTFSGNTGSTIFYWGDIRMDLGNIALSAITPSNSGITQNTGNIFTGATFATIDGNTVATSYTGVSYDFFVSGMTDLGGGNYSGDLRSSLFEVLSAATLDFTGRTIWVDVSGKIRTNELIVTKNPVIGYVLTCVDAEGGVAFMVSSGATSGSTSGLTADTYWISGSTGAYSLKAKNDTPIDATGMYALAEGSGTTASGVGSHAEGRKTTALGDYSHAEGFRTVASGTGTHSEGFANTAGSDYSHAEGFGNIAYGFFSHVEGGETSAYGTSAHAEGNNTIASGDSSHAEGDYTVANGDSSHSEGSGTTANGKTSHAEGFKTTASGFGSHAEGGAAFGVKGGIASGNASHAEGAGTIASGLTSHAEGSGTTAGGLHAHAEGRLTVASGVYSHAEGTFSTASGQASHAEGWGCVASSIQCHAEGNITTALGNDSHSEGDTTTASGSSSHAEGAFTTAGGSASHSEGDRTIAIGLGSHAEGGYTTAIGDYSHTEGSGTTAFGKTAHAEGSGTTAFGNWSHAEGLFTIASGLTAHAEGDHTTATGDYSHSEGSGTTATGLTAHAEGYGTTAGDVDHAEGGFTTAIGGASHAEGQLTIALGINSHAEGEGSVALGANSHAEGANTKANGVGSHSEGDISQANGLTSHAQGFDTTAGGDYSHAGGQQSIASGNTSFIHSTNSIVLGDRSVVLGGQGLTGSSNDYVYVPSLNVNVVGSGAFVNDIRIDATGNLTTNTSDRRLKENITPLSGALKTILQLSGVTYQWIDKKAGGNDFRIGFIAQDVEAVEPLLIFTNKNDGYKGIHIDSIIPLLVEAVKELSTGVTTSGNVYLETQTILAEDNNIELNYSGTSNTAIGGGIIVLHAKGNNSPANFITDEDGNWVTNNDFKPNAITIPFYIPTSSNDENGNIGNMTRDNDYTYIKTANGWKRSNLESF